MANFTTIDRDVINLFHVFFVSYLLYSLATQGEGEPNVVAKFVTNKNFLIMLAVGIPIYHLYLLNSRKPICQRLGNLFSGLSSTLK